MDRREKPEQKGGNEGKSYMKEWSETMDDSGKRKKKVLSRFWAHREHKQDMNAWICWRSGAKSEGSWVKECSQVKMMRTRRVVSLSVPSLSLCLSTSLPRSLLGRLTLPFIHLTAHRRGDEWRSGEGWKSGMRGEGRMSIRRTSKCSPADLLEERRERETDTHRNNGWTLAQQRGWNSSSLYKSQQHNCCSCGNPNRIARKRPGARAVWEMYCVTMQPWRPRPRTLEVSDLPFSVSLRFPLAFHSFPMIPLKLL